MRSECCKVPIKKFYQYGGAIEFDVCSKCGKPQAYGKIKKINQTLKLEENELKTKLTEEK